MKKHVWKSYAIWILLAEGVGFLAGWLTREGTEIYKSVIQKPPLSPPSIVFPIVWAILFALMGIGAARVYLSPKTPERSMGLNIFIVQLVVNFLWSLIFFNIQAYGFAFFWQLVRKSSS